MSATVSCEHCLLGCSIVVDADFYKKHTKTILQIKSVLHVTKLVNKNQSSVYRINRKACTHISTFWIIILHHDSTALCVNVYEGRDSGKKNWMKGVELKRVGGLLLRPSVAQQDHQNSAALSTNYKIVSCHFITHDQSMT